MARTDAELVGLVLTGETDLFRDLMERHQDSVFRIAMHYTGNIETATDISQEAFFRAFKKLQSLKDPAFFYGWLRQISLNLCMDWLRARNGNPKSLDTLREHGFDVGVSISQPRISTVEQEMQLKTIKQIVVDTLENISEDAREILLLRYFEGLTVAQISETLGLKENTTKVRLFRARESLRPMLEELHSNGELICDGLSIRPM